jgi:hypothetical protein
MVGLAVRNEAFEVARQLYGNRSRARGEFTQRLLDIYEQAEGKDFLVIHNPGGWGCSRFDRCLDWERSIIEGVKTTIDKLGYSSAITQYFRARDSLWAHFMDTREQARIMVNGKYSRARIMAAELGFLTSHLDRVKVIMVGVSQGAGFSNAVMRQLEGRERVYSIELGMVFRHVPRRLCNDHTLAIDGNGVYRDPIVHRDLWAGAKAYAVAPLLWLRYQLVRKPRRFTRCVVMPGHDYSWEYPGVRRKIEDFLGSKFGKAREEMSS